MRASARPRAGGVRRRPSTTRPSGRVPRDPRGPFRAGPFPIRRRPSARVGSRVRPSPRAVRRTGRPSGTPVRARELRLLADLLAAGVPLLDGLTTLARTADRRRGGARLHAAAREIEEGRRIATVLGAGAPHVEALLTVGEEVGRLASALASAADLEERLAAARHRVAAALAYPVLVLVVAVGVVAVVVTTAVPQMAATLSDLGADLPWVTRVVLRFADATSSPAALAAPALGLLGAIIVRAARRGRPEGPAVAGPGRGPLGGRALEVVVATRVIATLLAHSLPLVAALEAAVATSRRHDVRDALGAAVAGVATGRRLVDVVELRTILPEADLLVLAVGEERGLLATQFGRLAERRLADLERRLEVIGALAEPALVLVVGTIVGGVVAALYLPSFRVVELL